MKEPNFSFSPEVFKKWMEQYKGEESKKIKQNNLIGLAVESKISPRRLAIRIEPKEGSLRTLIADFKNKGGVIYDVEDKKFLIEVDSGFFYIPRYLVKRISPSS